MLPVPHSAVIRRRFALPPQIFGVLEVGSLIFTRKEKLGTEFGSPIRPSIDDASPDFGERWPDDPIRQMPFWSTLRAEQLPGLSGDT